MKIVRLYGVMGEAFGREHRLAVRSPAEAVRALCCTVPGFRRWLIERKDWGFRVWAGAARRSAAELAYPCGEREVIRIAPVLEGAGSGKGLLGIVAGIALLVFAPEIGFALSGPLFSAATVTAFVGAIGWGLILGGISSMLFKPPTTPDVAEQEPVESKPSFVFDGPVNTVREGNAVQLVYGRVRCGSQVISAGLRTEQIA